MVAAFLVRTFSMPRRSGDAAEAFEIAKIIGAQARRLRRWRGWTQAGMSERLGMTAEAYGRLERGMSLPSFPTFIRACRNFHARNGRSAWIGRSVQGPRRGIEKVVRVESDMSPGWIASSHGRECLRRAY